MLEKRTKLTNCLECSTETTRPKFCKDRCANTYRARLRRNRISKTVYLSECMWCQEEIFPPRRSFCSYKHKNLYNHKIRYAGKYQRDYHAKSPENFITKLLEKKCREDLRKAKNEVFALYHKQEGKCAISGVKLTHIRSEGKVYTNISIDQIDPSKGYTLDNIQFVCFVVNMMKHTMTKEQLISWCKTIIENNKHD